jgi:hypothetical protein
LFFHQGGTANRCVALGLCISKGGLQSADARLHALLQLLLLLLLLIALGSERCLKPLDISDSSAIQQKSDCGI